MDVRLLRRGAAIAVAVAFAVAGGGTLPEAPPPRRRPRGGSSGCGGSSGDGGGGRRRRSGGAADELLRGRARERQRLFDRQQLDPLEVNDGHGVVDSQKERLGEWKEKERTRRRSEQKNHNKKNFATKKKKKSRQKKKELTLRYLFWNGTIPSPCRSSTDRMPTALWGSVLPPAVVDDDVRVGGKRERKKKEAGQRSRVRGRRESRASERGRRWPKFSTESPTLFRGRTAPSHCSTGSCHRLISTP